MGQCCSSSTPISMQEQGGQSSTREESSRSLWGRWLLAAKEQRSRFYVLRRCIIMLLCWHKYGKYYE